jgi:hypothetical protein
MTWFSNMNSIDIREKERYPLELHRPCETGTDMNVQHLQPCSSSLTEAEYISASMV